MNKNKVAILNISSPGDNKEFNGGYGTTFEVGDSLKSKFLMYIRNKLEFLPLLNDGYVNSVFSNKGIEVKYYNNQIPAEDIILLHTSLIRFNEEIDFIKKIKLKKPNSLVIVHGPLVSSIPEHYKLIADTIIKGEIENVFTKYESLTDLPKGIVDLGYVDDINALPFPNWDIFNYKSFKQFPILKKWPVFMVLGSRSCPYKCNYCPYISNENKYRFRTVDNVIEELVYLKQKYKAKAILFRDPVFSMKKKWVLELCEKMIEKKLDLTWVCETRLDRMDEELVDKMYEAGFRGIEVGIESYDHEQLKKLSRVPPDKEHQESIIKYMEGKGISVISFYVLGLPDDTVESMQSTIDYAQKLNTSFANFTICTPIPGTGFYNEIKDQIFDHNFQNYDNFHPVFHLKNIRPEDVKQMKEKALTGYYLRSQYFKKHFISFI